MGLTRKGFIRGLSLLSLEGILENAKEPLSFEQLRLRSRPIHKQSFLKYLRFCKEKQLLECKKFTNSSTYLISEKGRKFLGLIQ